MAVIDKNALVAVELARSGIRAEDSVVSVGEHWRLRHRLFGLHRRLVLCWVDLEHTTGVVGNRIQATVLGTQDGTMELPTSSAQVRPDELRAPFVRHDLQDAGCILWYTVDAPVLRGEHSAIPFALTREQPRAAEGGDGSAEAIGDEHVVRVRLSVYPLEGDLEHAIRAARHPVDVAVRTNSPPMPLPLGAEQVRGQRHQRDGLPGGVYAQHRVRMGGHSVDAPITPTDAAQPLVHALERRSASRT
mmetsp:Transcript_42359/g.123027  ORF Transcript_42359/g.123027 Transcript_42359/m.123027 type:complete len:246 (+) Transcript_42359:451-1188(+)